MTYLKPTYDNINFTVTSGYVAPEFNTVFFDLPSSVDYVEGSVLEGTTALSGTTLYLYKRTTGELVSSTTTTYSGTFELPYLDAEEHYFVVALYPTSEFNALIYDYVYPTISGGS